MLLIFSSLNFPFVLDREMGILRTDAAHFRPGVALEKEHELDRVILVESHCPVLIKGRIQKSLHLPVETF